MQPKHENNKTNNRKQFGSKFDERTNVSLVFLKLIEVDCDFFFDQNLKHMQKAHSIFYFQISLFDFFLWLVSPGFCCSFVFLIKQNKRWGTQTNYNQFLSPIFCFV